MQDLPPIPDELPPPELIRHRVQNPGMKQPEQHADHHEGHGVAGDLDEEGPLEPVALGAAAADHHTVHEQVLCEVRIWCKDHLNEGGGAIQGRDGEAEAADVGQVAR